jgi:hypothetical protein
MQEYAIVVETVTVAAHDVAPTHVCPDFVGRFQYRRFLPSSPLLQIMFVRFPNLEQVGPVQGEGRNKKSAWYAFSARCQMESNDFPHESVVRTNFDKIVPFTTLVTLNIHYTFPNKENMRI